MSGSKNTISYNIQTQLLGLDGVSKKNLNDTAKVIAQMTEPLTKKLGIQFDANSIRGITQLENAFKSLNASIDTTKNSIKIVLENANGLTAIAKSGVFNGEIQKASNGGFNDITLADSRLTPTKQLAQLYDQVYKAQEKVNKLSLTDKNSGAYQTATETLKRYETELQNYIGLLQKKYNLTVQDGMIQGQGSLAQTQRALEYKKLQQAEEQELAVSKQAHQEEAANVNNLIQITNMLYAAEEKLLKMKLSSKGSTDEQNAIAKQQEYVDILTREKDAIQNNVTSTQAWQDNLQTLVLGEEKHSAIMAEIEAQAANKAAEEKTRRESQQVNEYISLLKQRQSAELELKKMEQSYGSKPNSSQTEALMAQKAYTSGLQQQESALKQNISGTTAYTSVKSKIVNLENQHTAALAKLNVTTKKTNSLFGGLKNTFKIVMQSGLSWRLFSLLSQGLRNTINNVKELNKAFVDLQIVTQRTDEGVKELLSHYNEMATALGTTTSEVAESATEWLRQGYSIQDTNELIEQSTILSKVGMIDSAEATKYLTSAIKGYKLEVGDASYITDMATAIDMKAAVSSGDLLEALSKTANMADEAGIKINQVFAMIAAGMEVTQADASSYGNALKTMLSRMQRVAAGAATDDEGEAINAVEESLKSQGITLRTTANEWRNFYDVLDEVSEKMKSGELDGVEESKVMYALGGTRQQENARAMLQNWDKVREYAQLAAESEGTAYEKYQSYLEGIEAAQEKLTANFEKFSMALIDSGLVKLVYDLGSELLSLLSYIAKAGTAIIAVLSVIATYNIVAKVTALVKSIGHIKNLKIIQFGKSLVSISKLKTIATQSETLAIDAAREAEELRTIAEYKAGAAKLGLMTQTEANTAAEAADTAAKTAQTLATKAQGDAAAVAAAKNALLNVVITGVIIAIIGAIWAIKNYKSAYEKAFEKFEKYSEELKDLREELESVNEELKTTTDRIAELESKGSLTLADAEELANLKKKTAELMAQTAELEHQEEIKAKEVAKATKTVYEKATGRSVSRSDAYITGTDSDGIQTYSTNWIDAYRRDLITLQNAIDDHDSDAYNSTLNRMEKSKKYAEETYNAAVEYKKLVESLTDAERITILGSDWEEKLEEADDLIHLYYSAIGYDSTVSSEAIEAANAVASKSVEALSADLDDLKKRYDDLSSAQEEYSSNGYISLETFDKLISDYEDYIPLLVEENGQLNFNTQSLKDNMVATALNMANKAALNYVEKFVGKTAEEVANIFNSETASIVTNTAAMYENIAAQINALDISAELKNQIWSNAMSYFKLAKSIGSISTSTSSSSEAEKAYTKAIQYAQETIQRKIDALNKEKEAIQEKNEATQKELDLYDKAISYINKTVELRIQALEDEKEALEKKNDEKKREIELQELQNNLQKANQRTMRVYHEDTGWTWEVDPNAVKEAQEALDDFNTETQKEEIDELIEAWEEYKDALSEVTSAYEEETDEQAFLENQNYITLTDIENKDLTALERFKTSYKNKQKSIAENTTDAIDKQIDAWNDLKDKYADISSNYTYYENQKYAISVWGANAEQDILSGRLDMVQAFTDGYAAEMNAQASAAESAANRITAAISSIPNISFNDGTVGGTTSTTATNMEELKAQLEASRGTKKIATLNGLSSNHNYYNSSWEATGSNTGKVSVDKKFTIYDSKRKTINGEEYLLLKTSNTDDNHWIRVKAQKIADKVYGLDYAATGTKSSKSGLYNLNELGDELVVPPASQGNYQILQKGTGVLNHGLTERLMALATNPTFYMRTALNSVGIGTPENNQNNQTISIQNLNLPNVKDTNDFIKELQIITHNR